MLNIKALAGGLLGRLMGMGLLAGGFWLLFAAFNDSRIPLGVLGGAMILLGMWTLARLRRGQGR